MNVYSELSDADLAVLLKEGNEAVFKILYQKYWTKLYVVATKRLGDPLEAEEVVQDIFLDLWRRREKLELRKTFDHYLAVAVKFEVIERRAKRARQPVMIDELNKAEQPVEYTSWHKFDLDYLQTQLDSTINSLPPQCKLIFKMSRETDSTNKQIAKALNISEKAVEKNITRALKVLRSRFGRHFSILLILF